MTDVVIPSAVKEVGRQAFAGCSSLTTVIIPNSVKRIGYEAFHNCRSLSNITIPNSVTYIEDGAFRGCSNLTTINIPSSVISIGRFSFWGCEKMWNFGIPLGVTLREYHYNSDGPDRDHVLSDIQSMTYFEQETLMGYFFYGVKSLDEEFELNGVKIFREIQYQRKARAEERERSAQWASSGRCPSCGGQFSLFGGTCKNCGKKRPNLR